MLYGKTVLKGLVNIVEKHLQWCRTSTKLKSSPYSFIINKNFMTKPSLRIWQFARPLLTNASKVSWFVLEINISGSITTDETFTVNIGGFYCNF